MKTDLVVRVYVLGPIWQTQDPFLFCAYHLDKYPKGNEQMGPDPDLLLGRPLGNDFLVKDGWRMYHGHTIPGFPYHPHRGFETVTLANQGYCDHSDSLGAAGRFGGGDVQWMTAGRGVQHSEMFPLLDQDKENTLELFQVWLNLPQKNKFVDPHFKMLWREELPIVKKKGAVVTLIAGGFEGQKAPSPTPNSWAADEENEVAIWNLTIEAGAGFTLPKAEQKVNRSLYFYEGSTIEHNGTTIAVGHGLDISAAEPFTFSTGDSACKLLLLQGKPINEPVAQQGPFVMNTQTELQQAFEEYRLTQFGGWPWPRPDNVHLKEKGRFAKYPDGSLIIK